MIQLDINNGGQITLQQFDGDDGIHVELCDNKGKPYERYVIEAADMVTLLNWYNTQKDNGNNDLIF